MKTLLKWALALGAAPLVFGIGIFIVWALVRADWLMFAGIATIYVGICALAAGLSCLGLTSLSTYNSLFVDSSSS